MTVRQVEGLFWVATDPSRYYLQGYPMIQAYYNGRSWYIRGFDEPFLSLAQASKVLGLVVQKMQKRS